MGVSVGGAVLNLKVGQIVYLEPGRGQRHLNGLAKDEIVEGVLTKIGRKYYTVKIGHNDYQFELDGLREKSEYGQSYTLYFEKQALLDERERLHLFHTIRSAFEGLGKSPFTLDQLRRVKDILGEEDSE